MVDSLGRTSQAVTGPSQYNNKMIRKKISVMLFVACLLLCFPAISNLLAQSKTEERPESQAFEGAVSMAENLSQWVLLIIGGSVVIILGTDYVTPGRKLRLSYLLFIPGWIFLAFSLYYGTQVQRAHLSWLFRASEMDPEDIARLAGTITSDAYHQMLYMRWGLLSFGIWLLVYLFWWIFRPDASRNAGAGGTETSVVSKVPLLPSPETQKPNSK